MTTSPLPYLIIDADQHSTPPPDAYERYIDPKQREKAVRDVKGSDGKTRTLYAGKRMRMPPKNFQVTFNDDTLGEIGLKGAGNIEEGSDRDVQNVIPGSLLNRLNPLRSLDEEGRADFVKHYRALQPLLDNPADRTSVMDDQGIQATINFAGPLGLEFEFEHDLEGLYANLRAINRYIATEWKFNYQDRIFTPPFISLASAELALAELKSEHLELELVRSRALGAQEVISALSAKLLDADFDTRQSLLRLLVERVVVHGQSLEIHLALPVSSNGGLTSEPMKERGWPRSGHRDRLPDSHA